MRRGRWGLGMVALAFATGSVLSAPPVAATSASVGVGVGVGVGTGPVQRCAHLRGSATLSPGVTNTPSTNTVTANGTLTNCARSLRTGGSGSFTASITLPAASCPKLAAGGQKLKGTGSTTWRSGRVSNYKLTFTTGKKSSALVATIAGKVTSGLFAGHQVSGQVKLSPVGSPNCTTTPVTNVSFTSTKPFVIS